MGRSIRYRSAKLVGDELEYFHTLDSMTDRYLWKGIPIER